MKSAQGIPTVRGGMTSHAAVVARGMGKMCIRDRKCCMFHMVKKVTPKNNKNPHTPVREEGRFTKYGKDFRQNRSTCKEDVYKRQILG